MEQVTKLDAHGSVPYVAEALTRLREEVGNQSTVLGFVGAPFTLATYIVEGGSSKNYTHMKRLMFTQPEVLHAFLSKMADNIADYVRYQVLLLFHACHMHFALCKPFLRLPRETSSLQQLSWAGHALYSHRPGRLVLHQSAENVEFEFRTDSNCAMIPFDSHWL